MSADYEQFYDNRYLNADNSASAKPIARSSAWVSWLIIVTVAALILLFTWRMGVAYGAMPALTRSVVAPVHVERRCYAGLSVQWLQSGEDPKPFIVAIFPTRGC